MESTGEPDRVQVTEQTALLLEGLGYLLKYRHRCDLKKEMDKGGSMATKFVHTYWVYRDLDSVVIDQEEKLHTSSVVSPSITVHQ